MKRRVPVIVGALLLALFFAPQLPPVRDALLRRAVRFAAEQGYTVTYQKSAGNPWYGVNLGGVDVNGPGVDASAESLRVGYTLPALVTGVLPLRADVAGVRGSVDLDALPEAAPEPQAEPRRPRVRPLLSRADVSDVDLEVKGAPFSVPDGKITNLEVEQDGDALVFGAAVAVQDAVAEVSGRATLAPFKLDMAVERADVTLAESYFGGLDGGTLSGTVAVDENGTRADLELQDGQVALVGLDLANISGPVRVRGQKLTTELTGRALGGPLFGEATVDLGAQRWQADVTGDAELADAIRWLGRDRLAPGVVAALAPSGSAAVSLSASGWQQLTVSGTATGQGDLLGEPLRDLDVNFGFKSGQSTTATGAAQLGGAPLSFSLTPEEQGFSLRADGKDLPLHGLADGLTDDLAGDLNVDLTQRGGVLSGTAALDLDGRAGGRAVRGRVQATTEGRAWQLDVSGQDALGARASGQFELEDGALKGAADVRGLELPGLANPVTLNARADGPLTDLPLTLSAGGPQGVRAEAGGVRADADFSGEATATFKGGTLGGIEGNFGPLALSGSLNDLRYTLAPTEVSGRASGEVAVQEGRLTRAAGRLESTARLETKNLRSANVTLPNLNAEVSLGQGGPNQKASAREPSTEPAQGASPKQRSSAKQNSSFTATLKDADAGIDVELRDGTLRGELNGARVGALGDTFAVTGEVSGQAAKLTKTLKLDVRAQTSGEVSTESGTRNSPVTTLRAVGDAKRTRVSVDAEKGATLAGRTLGGALELSGDASLTERRADLSGTLGGVGVKVDAAPNKDGRIRTQAGLKAGGDVFEAGFDSLERWETDGTLPLAELGDALGVPLTGTLQTTLARQGDTFSGAAALYGEVFGLPLEADVDTQNDALTLDANTTLLGQRVTLTGQALPRTDATLSFGPYGQVQLSGVFPALRADGSGRVPGFERAGLEVAPQDWTLNGGRKAGKVGLQLGASRVTATRGLGGWRLDAGLKQRAQWRGTPLTLDADLTRTPQRPDGRLEGELTLGGSASGESALTLGGTLRDLNVSGTLPAGALQNGLLGRVETDLNANAFTQTYEAKTRWQRLDGSEALTLSAEGEGGKLDATAEADGLNARFSNIQEKPTWRLEADRYELAKLPVAQLEGLGAQLDGTLSAQGGDYDGRLQLSSSLGKAQLTGTEAGLELSAAIKRGPLQADVSGTVLPALELTVQAQAADAARLNGTVTGTLNDPQFRATVATTPQTLGGRQLRVPARQLELRASLTDGLSARLNGDATDVQLQDGRWTGDLALPFTLRDEPHRLAGSVQGALSTPTLTAELIGPTVAGPLTLNRQGLAGDLTVTPGLSAVPDARLEVGLRATPDLSWQADLKGAATLPYRSLPATFQGRAQGEGVRYTGTGTATVAGEAVAVKLSGEAASVQARAALDGVRLEPFVPAEGTLSGDVRVTNSGELRYFARLDAVGRAAGRPFELTLNADRATGLSLGGSAAGASVSVTGPLPLRTLKLTVANSDEPLELTSTLELGETLSLQGSGSWRGEPLALTGTYAPGSGDGTLELTLADAALNTSLQAEGEGRTLKAALTAPAGLPNMRTPLRLDAEVAQAGQTLTVTKLDARVGENTLELAGTVQPKADVSGTLTVPAAGDPIALRLKSLESGYLASLTEGPLELRGVLKPNFVPERARLVGTLELEAKALPDLGLESNLVWQEGAGFEGRADLSVSRDDAAATLTLVGEKELRVRGGGRYRGAEVVGLSAKLSEEPWRDRRVTGTVELDAPVHDLSPAWFGDPLWVVGDFGVSGTLTEPQLAGPLALRGALTATGRVEADRQGAEVSLKGKGLRGVATVGADGYRSTVSLNALDVSGLVPLETAPTLSGAVRATQTWGGAPQAQSELRLGLGESTVQGRVRLAQGVSGTLELDVRLPDLNPNLRGRVTGPLRLTAQGPLSGSLTLADLGTAAADWRLGGQGTLSGTLNDLVVGATLTGSGEAKGTLRVAASPRSGRLELTSDLALLGAETDFTLTRTPQRARAAGTLNYGDFGVQLGAEGDGVLLTGKAKLKGWRGALTPERVSLTGPLKSLNPQLAGNLELDGPADFSKLSGALTGAAFGPVALGDVALTAQTRQLTLQGEALHATVGLSPELPWTLGRLELALPGAGLRVSGEGDRKQGVVSGTLQAASSDLPVTARYGPQGAALEAGGPLPVGTLDLRARYDGDAWQGHLNIADDDQDDKKFIQSTLSGPRAAPKLVGQLDLERGQNTVQGTFSVGRDAAQLEARLSSPQLSAPLTARGSGWPLELTLATPDSALGLALQNGRLEPSGALELGAGPARVALRAEGGRLRVVARAPAAPGFALQTTLPEKPGDYGALQNGVKLTGVERTEGTVSLRARPTPGFSADDLVWHAPAGTLSLSGSGGLGDARTLAVEGSWRGADDAALPWLRTLVPFSAQLENDGFSAESVSDLGRVAAQWRRASGRLEVQTDLTLGQGVVAADVSYTRADGPRGTVDLTGVPIFKVGESGATLQSQLTLTPQGVAGRGALALVGGQADLSGQAGWARLLPAPLQRFVPAGGDALQADVRLERFDLGSVPQLAARLPYLDAPVSGVATLSGTSAGTQVVGQLVAPELRVSNTPLPTRVEFNGTLSALETRASVADSRLNIRYSRADGGTLAGLVTLEGFPLQTLAEAVVGASKVEADVTGAARFELPLSAPERGYVRLATERLSLKNTGPRGGGKTTEGSVALRFENGSLFVERAEFRGEGFWQASGNLTPEKLDFTLEAQDADFTPLLRLVPRLAAFNVGAEGSLNVQASGSVSAPDISLVSPNLEVRVAGTSYRALETQASLSGGAFGLRSSLVGVAPITGTLELRGSGQVSLSPFATNNFGLRFSGDADVPTLGAVTNIEGRIYPADRGWQLSSSGDLGAPFTVSGDLAPLDLKLEGEGLNVRARPLFVASSTTDVTLNLRSEGVGFVVSGDAQARSAQLLLNRQGGAGEGAADAAGKAPQISTKTLSQPTTGQTGEDASALSGALDTSTTDAVTDAATHVAADTPTTTTANTATDLTAGNPEATPVAVTTTPEPLVDEVNPVLQRIRFDDVRVSAPQEVLFQEAFGNAELSVDLTLSGTAAAPRLDGEVETLRGSIRFSGEDFALTRAVASFASAQGAFPTLDLEARARFDKSRALGDAGGTLRFADTSDSSFDVQLAITGAFEAVGDRRILDLEPTLTSSARVQEGSSLPRPLNEAELVSLLTLGRLQLDAPITPGALIGSNSLAGTVAESALDTAVDVLLVSELQDALGEALGVDLFEIRTSALSTFLGADGGEQNFGVSVKVGGYLSDNLFASVQVGRYDDPDQNVELSNEFLLRYTAAPLELNLGGGVDFLGQRTVTNFSLGLSYAISPLISLDASLDTTALGQKTSVGFGVSFSW